MPLEQNFDGTMGESSQGATALIQYDLKGDQGVWLHPYVAMSYAMSNPEFQAEVNIWIVDLMTIGTVNPHVLRWTQDKIERGLKFNRDDIDELYSKFQPKLGKIDNQQKDKTRERLITLCEKGIVQVDKWMDRDTPAAQEQLGICWAYLKAGCSFRITSEEECVFLTMFHPTFRTIESQYPGEPEELESTDFYIPTERKIKECKGKDWY